MEYRHILWNEAAGVATLTMNRPERLNSLNAAMLDEMLHAVGRIGDGRSAARCLVLTASGRGFCTGADLRADLGAAAEGGPIDAGRILESHCNPLLEQLLALPVPLVTAVNGPAAGAGCSYALAGDIILAARSAYFLQAFVHVGLVPDVGSTWMLPRMIGRARASRMMLLGEKIAAEEACAWGMVSEVVDDEALPRRTGEIAARLANGPTRALALIRRAIRDSLETSLSEALLQERRNQLLAGRTADFAEGLAAFREKRPAKFRGE